MNHVTSHIGAMSADAIAAVCRLQAEAENLPQVEIETRHSLHAGMYARTIMVPAGVLAVGVFIKIATLLIISGRGAVYIDGAAREVDGYHVIEGDAGRKQAWLSFDDTHITMIFPSAAASVEEAEAEFTDEADRLLTRRPPLQGELPCPAP